MAGDANQGRTETDIQSKANDTATSLLGLTMVPCIHDKLGDELNDEQLDELADRLEDAVTDEVAATLREARAEA